MWAILANLIGGPIISGAIGAYKAKLANNLDKDKLAGDLAAKAIELDVKEAAINADILKSEQGNWMTRWVRPVWAMPFILFTWKVVVWDKLLGWGTTDALDPRMWSVFMLMVAAYFGGRSAEKVATTIAAAFKR